MLNLILAAAGADPMDNPPEDFPLRSDPPAGLVLLVVIVLAIFAFGVWKRAQTPRR